jgi:hypothetical protein
VSQLFKSYAECHYAECQYAECHYAECHVAGCHYAECRYAECRGTVNTSLRKNLTVQSNYEKILVTIRSSLLLMIIYTCTIHYNYLQAHLQNVKAHNNNNNFFNAKQQRLG